MFSRSRTLHCIFLWLATAAVLWSQGQTHAQPAPKPNSAAANAALSAQEREAEQLKQMVEAAGDEPGAQLRALTAFLRKYPHPPAEDQILKLMIQDASQLDRQDLVLQYDERLQRLNPDDLAQRIRTLNLLLLSRDPDSRVRALRYAAELRQLIEVKAAQPAPAEIGPARWRRDMDRLRALADLLAGTASRHLGQNAAAAGQLEASLKLEPTEEAAEELGRVREAQHQPAAAIQAYALALALPGQTIAERYALRGKAGAMYRRLHGSEAGFGDLILSQFDRVARAAAARAPAAAQLAAPAPLDQIAFAALDGRTHRLAEYRGKVVVVDLWATWCGPCRVEHPLLQQLKRAYAASSRVVFVAINADSDRSRVPGFLRSQGWGKGTWFDAGLMNRLNIQALPTTLVLSPAGHLVYRESGLDPATFKQELKRAIQAALRRSTPVRAAARRIARAHSGH